MRAVFPLERVGYLVHGYGVAHAHFMIVPQQGPHHLTSDRLARLADGRIVFDLSSIKIAERATLDEQARLLSQL
jgi:histidine triad (HIT) family protein